MMSNGYTEAYNFYKGCPNFVTPEPMAYKTTPNYYVELSKGYFMGGWMYGVTVRDKCDKIEDSEDSMGLSKSFFDEQEARLYYRNIW